ncbi:MAG: hypothetical protein KGL74_11050, partial [Elusimicrobia bacterium]|nr:hypothetical protein [Elusimicrobiota bacterium]
MSNENDPIPTQTQNPAPAEKPAPKLQRVFDAPPPAEPQAAAPSTPSRREEQYPRADGPVEADRDVPQPEERRHDDVSGNEADDDGNDDSNDESGDDGGDDEGTNETSVPAPSGAAPAPEAPAAGAPGAAPQQGQASRQG